MFVLVAALQIVNFSTVNAAYGSSSVAEMLLGMTNDERAKNSLSPLVVNSKLSQAAMLKANDMLAHQYWAHVAPDGSTPWKWVDQAGYKYSYAGENLAKNFRTPQTVMAAWMASSEHRANILDSHYSEVGFASMAGTLRGKPVVLTVALYGTPATTTAGVAGSKTMGSLVGANIGITQRLYIASQSLSVASVVSIFLLLVGVIVALLTYAHRKKLPKKFHRAWYRHHGLVKASGMLSVSLFIVFLYSGGQI